MGPAIKATRGMWKIKAMPHKRALIPLQRTFTKAEFTKITSGFVPRSMDDRWFIFFEKGWLYFHRSWTGRCIFQVRLRTYKQCYQVAEAWANQNPRQYRNSDIGDAAEVLSNLIGQFLLAHRT